MNDLIMLLPITDTRPEPLRVIRQDEWYLVQARRPQGWITLSEHVAKPENQAVAIRECENWY